MPDAPAGLSAPPSRPANATDIHVLVAAVAASDIAVAAAAGDAHDAAFGIGDIDVEILRWIASHVKAGKRLSAH